MFVGRSVLLILASLMLLLAEIAAAGKPHYGPGMRPYHVSLIVADTFVVHSHSIMVLSWSMRDAALSVMK